MNFKTVVGFLLLLSSSVYAQTLKVNVLGLRGAKQADKTRINKALVLVEKVVNQKSFRDIVLNSTYTQTDLSPQTILDSILLAQENFAGGKKQVIDLFMEMYYEVDGSIGYTYSSDPYFYMNRWYHAGYSPMQTAGNIFHEWLHKLNHEHSFEWTEDRKDSVPYKLGYLVADMASDIESKGDPIAKQILLKSFQHDCNHH